MINMRFYILKLRQITRFTMRKPYLTVVFIFIALTIIAIPATQVLNVTAKKTNHRLLENPTSLLPAQTTPSTAPIKNNNSANQGTPTPAVTKTKPTITPTPVIKISPTPILRTPNPPKINISYPSEMQSVEFTSPDQKLCVVDILAGGDTSGLQLRQNTNNSGWSGYSSIFTLCFDPKEGLNVVQLQYRNKYGEESVIYARQFNFHRVGEISVVLSGQLYRDENCNGTRDSGEGGIGTSATINIFKMPEFYIYSTINTDGNGSYSFSGKIKENESLALQPGAVSPSGYTSNPNYSVPTITFNSSNQSVTLDMPQVPNEYHCSGQ